jgi:hypothetical protein
MRLRNKIALGVSGTVLCVFIICCGCSLIFVEGPQIPVPPFQIKVALTDAAAKKLRDTGESIKGDVIFEGDGLSQRWYEIVSAQGFHPVGLGVYNFETMEAGIIFITNAVIREKSFQRLTDTNYFCAVNASSGRRVFSNNIIILRGYPEVRISDAVKAPIEITCDLIK